MARKIRSNENKRIIDLVRRFKKDNSDKEAFSEISKMLDNYMLYLSQKFFLSGHSKDDVYQEALLALAVKAIPDYKEDKGPFVGFAKMCVRRHIITVLKSANNNKNKTLNASVSLDATVCDDEDGPVSLSGFFRNGDEDLVDKMVREESHERLKRLLFTKLTILEKRVLSLYMQGHSYSDIKKKMNKGRRKIKVDCKVIDNALCRIKKKAIELHKAIKRGEIPSGSDIIEN